MSAKVESIFSHGTPGSYLQSLLAPKRSGGRPYSLRSLAKDLSLSPSHLSHVIRGKKNMSVGMAWRIAQALELGPDETEYLSLLAQQASPRLGRETRRNADARLQRLREGRCIKPVVVDQGQLLRHWYHVPILEMSYLDDFPLTAASVSARLGISDVEAALGLERLERVGLLERQADGRLVKTKRNCVFRTDRASDAFKAYLLQMLGLAGRAVEEQPLPERFFATQTFSIGRDQIEPAKELIREFVQRMGDLFEKAAWRDDTYQLNVQFFRLTDGRPKSRS